MKISVSFFAAFITVGFAAPSIEAHEIPSLVGTWNSQCISYVDVSLKIKLELTTDTFRMIYYDFAEPNCQGDSGEDPATGTYRITPRSTADLWDLDLAFIQGFSHYTIFTYGTDTFTYAADVSEKPENRPSRIGFGIVMMKETVVIEP